jgi:hypothetical protein
VGIYKTEPWTHQRKEVEQHWMDENRMLIWDMRTGKTKAAIDSAVMNYLSGGIDRLLIVAPNGVHDNWLLNEFPVHCSVPYYSFSWNSSQVTTARFQTAWQEFQKAKGFRVFSINQEAIRVIGAEPYLKTFLMMGPCGLVVDEAHHFGKVSSRMSKRLAGSVSKYCVWRRLLTGTPVDNSPLKYYSICNVIRPGLLGYTRVKDFQERYANWRIEKSNARMFARVTSYKNLDELVANVRVFSSMVKREDCVDLPRTILMDRKFYLTSKQIALIEEVEARQKREEISRDAAVPLIQSISSGIGVEGENPRMAALLELLEESDEKVLVWCRFVREIKMLKEVLGDRAVCYYGEVSNANRQLAIQRFQSDPVIRVFIGQPQAAGEGLRLSSAGYVVWYSHTWDATVCTQASKRAIQMGGKDIPVYRLTAVGARDDVILRNLKMKRNTVNSMEAEWRRQDGR